MHGIIHSLLGLYRAVPCQNKLILHIAVTVCSKPSGSGCKVLLKCYQLKTVMLCLILTCLTACLHVYETEDEVYVSEDCCCYGAVILL